MPTYRWCAIAVSCLASLLSQAYAFSVRGEEVLRDTFDGKSLSGWHIRDGKWEARDNALHADAGFAVIVRDKDLRQDFDMTADVAYISDNTHAASGLLFRLGEDFTGYGVCLREIEKGVNADSVPWERPVLQLYRFDKDGWKLLQESKVMNGRSNELRRLRVVCQGTSIWAYYMDMTTPVLTQYDDRYNRSGRLGLWKDQIGQARFANVKIAPVGKVAPAPLQTDWSWVRGAVYVRSDAVNAVQMWQDYWEHVEVLDRELSYAKLYGFNMVQVYLHWIVWDRHKEEYLKRIDDFLTRAAKHGLKVNFILWDDCGNVEPSLTFAPPIPGRHNSQMMMNPSHSIRDSEAEMTAHRERFGEYVSGVVGRFKDDRRISFWQLYNEGMGLKEQYRIGQGDANLNRLLRWTRAWVKDTGTDIPVTATGGGFFGPQYADFYTYHSYAGPEGHLPNAEGGPEHLCTETLNRPNADLITCLRDLAGKKNGFVIWEFMIGRDNCRFPWGHPDGADEPAVPFHGVIYPDGHPWEVREVKAMLGDVAFAALEKRVFRVEYFDGDFKTSRKTSLTPRIDFELADEPGNGSPDTSVSLGKDDFSIRWTGSLIAPTTGAYVFFDDSDGILHLSIDGTPVIAKADQGRREVRGDLKLVAGQTYEIKVEYVHRSGPAVNHLHWSGPQFDRRILHLDADPPVGKTK